MSSRPIPVHGATTPAAFLTFLRQHASRFPVAALARQAGVSRTTVSRVLSGSPSVTVESLTSVLEAVTALGTPVELMVVVKKATT